MLPPWLLEGPIGLAAAVDRACDLPGPTGQTCAAPLPQTTGGWARAAAAAQRAVLPLGPVVVVDRDRADADAVASAGPLPDAALVRLPGTGAHRWVVRDRAAQIRELRAGWTLFGTLRVPAAVAVVDLPAKADEARPIPARRGHPALFPGARLCCTNPVMVGVPPSPDGLIPRFQ